MRLITLVSAVFFFAGAPLQAQERPAERPPERPQPQQEPHHNEPKANQGRIPPAPPRAAPSNNFKTHEERRDNGAIDRTPHVNNDRWYGHADPNDKRYHIDHPYQHGRFEHFGPSYRYNVVRVDRDRHEFWFPGGFYFEIAPWDWSLAADWCWNCGDNFVVYDDPDHPGWYLVYNTDTGAYAHAMYMGG